MQITKSAWWTHKRLLFNKRLAIAGIASILITTITVYLKNGFSSRDDKDILVIVTVFNLFSLGSSNLILILMEFADRQFGAKINDRSRDILFSVFFWFSLALQFVYPAFIIAMFCIY